MESQKSIEITILNRSASSAKWNILVTQLECPDHSKMSGIARTPEIDDVLFRTGPLGVKYHMEDLYFLGNGQQNHGRV